MKQSATVRTCPVCGHKYTEYPALSRKDNETEICGECGMREALETIDVTDRNDQNHIINLVKKYERK